jgi:hypothetical protein
LGQGSLIQVKIGKVSSGQFSWLDNPTSAVNKPDNQTTSKFAVVRPNNQTTRQFAVDGPDICRRQARQPDNQKICRRRARHLPSTGLTTRQSDNLQLKGPTSAVNRPDNQKTRQFAAVWLPTNAGVDFVARLQKVSHSSFFLSNFILSKIRLGVRLG